MKFALQLCGKGEISEDSMFDSFRFSDFERIFALKIVFKEFLAYFVALLLFLYTISYFLYCRRFKCLAGKLNL